MQCGIKWKFNGNLKWLYMGETWFKSLSIHYNDVLKSRYGHGMGIIISKNFINIAIQGTLISSQLSTVYGEYSIRVFIYSLRGYNNT